MMGKGNMARLCIIAAIIFLTFHHGAWAKDQEISLEVQKGSVREQVYVSAITGSTTFLPVRQMSELINVPLEWDGSMGSVVWQTYNQTTVITPGIETIYMIKESVAAQKAVARPFMEEGRVYIPLRTLELLGVGVAYDAPTDQRSLIIPENMNRPSAPMDQEKMNIVRDLIRKEKEQLPKKIGSFATYFNAADKFRTQNLKLAAEAINDFSLGRGMTFSFNETVGPRTPERGYEKATIFVNKQQVEGYGGGVCQVSTTLYNAVLDAKLSPVERHPHSLPVPYVPLGKDATVNYGTADFKFKNTIDLDITIKTSVEKNKLTVEIYSLPGGLDPDLL